MGKLKIDKYLAFALIFALLNMGAILVIFGAQKYADSAEYIRVINWFQGEDGSLPFHRLLKPLGFLIALPFEFLGEGAGLVVQNIFFYLLSALLIFKITELVYQNKKQALLASIFFVSATPVIEVGLSYLVDSGGWFFYLFSIFLTLLYFKTRNEKLIILNGFLSGLGFLMKETGGLGVPFFGLMILFSGTLSLKEKILKMARFGIIFLIPVVILQILVFKYFQFTYWDWYLMGRPGVEGEGVLLVFLRYLGQLFRILGILWPFILIGAWRELREKNWERLKIFLALIPSSFSFLLWSVNGGGRVVFIFAPLGILLATYGCKKIKPLMLGLIVLVILISNYFFVSVNKTIPFTDLIYTSIFSR